MTHSKDLIPILEQEERKKQYPVFKVIGKISSSIRRIIKGEKNTQEPVSKKSLLFNLDGIEDLKIAELMLDQMTDEEVIGDSDKKSLIKHFHPDIPNNGKEQFDPQVRNLIFLRINNIQKSGTKSNKENCTTSNWKEGKYYKYKGRTYYAKELYQHEDEQVSNLMTRAIDEMSNYGGSIIHLVQKVYHYLQELVLKESNSKRDRKFLLLNMRINIERILLEDSVINIMNLQKNINPEEILDIVIEIETISGIPCKRTKRSILVYFANCGLMGNYHPRKLREKVNQLGRKYEIATHDIGKNISHVSKGPKADTIIHPGREYLSKNHAPRRYIR